MPPNISPEWQKTIKELIKASSKLAYGEIVIRIHDGKPQITEYTVKRKVVDTDDFHVTDLLD